MTFISINRLHRIISASAVLIRLHDAFAAMAKTRRWRRETLRRLGRRRRD